MAARTAQAVDVTTLLHSGQVSVACAGLADPSGAPWIVMDDQAAAKNGLYVRNSASGVAVFVGVGGAGADANPALNIYAGNASNASTGTGALTLGSSAGTVVLGGAITASQGYTISSNMTVTGTVSASTVTSCTAVNASTVNSSGQANIGTGLTSSQRVGVLFGSSGPVIMYGSSVPTASAVVGSIFLNAGGSSTTTLYVCIPNGGTASSSNWDNVTGIA